MTSEARKPTHQGRSRDHPTKRLNVNLPIEAYAELQDLASGSSRSLTELVRLALGLVALALREVEAGNSLAIVDSAGEVKKEVVLPG